MDLGRKGIAEGLPWPWVTEGEELASLDVHGLDDAQLGNLARYRGFLAANTSPGKREHAEALRDLRDAFDELIRRGFGM